MFEWDGKVGPATIVGIVGSLSILVSIGIVWGTTTNKLDVYGNAITEITKNQHIRDSHIAQQSERLGKVETSVQFIVPTLQRIEAKLDTLPGKQ